MNLTLGYAVPMLPLQDSARITVGNALQADWRDVVPATSSLYVMGNPPFLGYDTRGADQLADLRHAWGGDRILSRMDYVTGWHAKTLDLFTDYRYRGEWAFVTTNSVTQGDQVPASTAGSSRAGASSSPPGREEHPGREALRHAQPYPDPNCVWLKADGRWQLHHRARAVRRGDGGSHRGEVRPQVRGSSRAPAQRGPLVPLA